jgi:hypothetical protein
MAGKFEIFNYKSGEFGAHLHARCDRSGPHRLAVVCWDNE